MPTKGEKRLNHEYQQHRFARIEGYNITRARLHSQFTNGISDPRQLVTTVSEYLSSPSSKTAWRRSEAEQAGYQEGVRLAALEFYWENRHNVAME